MINKQIYLCFYFIAAAANCLTVTIVYFYMKNSLDLQCKEENVNDASTLQKAFLPIKLKIAFIKLSIVFYTKQFIIFINQAAGKISVNQICEKYVIKRVIKKKIFWLPKSLLVYAVQVAT